jgi:hypothetical protein
MRYPWCPCVCESNHPLWQLNLWTKLYETWYVRVCHGTWAHLNVLFYKCLPSVSVSACISLLSLLSKGSVKCILPFTARQRLGKEAPAPKTLRNNRRNVGGFILWVCVSPFLARWQVGKEHPAAKKSRWRRRSLWVFVSKESRTFIHVDLKIFFFNQYLWRVGKLFRFLCRDGGVWSIFVFSVWCRFSFASLLCLRKAFIVYRVFILQV